MVKEDVKIEKGGSLDTSPFARSRFGGLLGMIGRAENADDVADLPSTTLFAGLGPLHYVQDDEEE